MKVLRAINHILLDKFSICMLNTLLRHLELLTLQNYNTSIQVNNRITMNREVYHGHPQTKYSYNGKEWIQRVNKQLLSATVKAWRFE